MNHRRAPVLEALAEYHQLDRYGFTPPGHRQGRGVDPRVRAVMGDAFRDDVLAWLPRFGSLGTAATIR